jgi:hypothetical protein
MACKETMRPCLDSKEPNPEEMQSEVEHWKVPTEHAAVETGKTPNRGRHLAAGRHGKPEELTRGNFGSRRKLAATSGR